MAAPAVAADAVVAAADIVRRSGGREYTIGYLRDEDDPLYEREGPGWWAAAMYRGARLTAEGHRRPDDAADELARRVLAGGQCQHCKRTIVIDPTSSQALARCTWRRVGARWDRACA